MSIMRLHNLFAAPMLLEWRYAQQLSALATRVMAGDVEATAEQRARVMADRMLRPKVTAAVRVLNASGAVMPASSAYAMVGRVAVVEVSGLLARTRDEVSDSEGRPFGTAYEDVDAGIDAAMANPSVGAVLMMVNSPGGMAQGCYALAEKIRGYADSGAKPVYTFALDTCSSAGLYLGVQCGRGNFGVAPDAFTGSIGSKCDVVLDYQALANAGIEVKSFASTPAKLIGNPSQPMPPEHAAAIQREIDVFGGQMEASVAAARGTDAATVRAWALKSGFIGQEAVAAGLADFVVADLAGMLERINADLASGGAATAMGGKKAVGFKASPRRIAGISNKPSASRGRKEQTMAKAPTREELATMEGGPELIAAIEQEASAKSAATDPDPNTEPDGDEQPANAEGDPAADPNAPPMDPAKKVPPKKTPPTPAKKPEEPATAPAAKGTTKEPQMTMAERVAQMKSALPDDPNFALDCVGRGLTLTEAKAEYCDLQTERLKEAKAKNSAAGGVPAPKVASKGVNFDPAKPATKTPTDEAFVDRIERIKNEKKVSFSRAVYLARQEDGEGFKKWQASVPAGSFRLGEMRAG